MLKALENNKIMRGIIPLRPHFILGLILFASLTISANVEVSSLECGGVLEGEQGQLTYPLTYEQANSKTCIWIVKVVYRQGIQFQLKQLSNETSVNVYSQYDFLGYAEPLSLNSSHIGSTFEFPGTTIVIILPDIEAHLSFQWVSMYEDNSAEIVSSDYITSPQGQLSWRPFGRLDSLLWILNLDDINGVVEISFRSTFTCCPSGSCLSWLHLFDVTPDGLLNEITRVIGNRHYGVYESGTSQVLAFLKTDGEPEGDLQITWSPTDAFGCALPTTLRPIEPTTTEIVSTAEPESDAILVFGAIRAPSDLTVNVLSVASGNVTSIPTKFQARAVSFDGARQEIFWAESCCGSSEAGGYGIYRARIDGSNVNQIADFKDGGIIIGISYDWINDNIYYTDTQRRQIGVCSRDGTGCSVIIEEDENVPCFITADPIHGKLYWSAPDSKKIFVSNLDGTEVNVFTEVSTAKPFRVSVNQEDSRLYWADVDTLTIESVSLDGTDHKIVHNTTFAPFAVAVDSSHIYWTTKENNGTIQRIGKGSTSTEEETVWYGSGVIPHDLAIYSSNQQPHVESSCQLK